jgi:DNA-binding transcriptional LysR family regulator
MNVKSLKVFCDVAGRRSFSLGAAASGVTQSCASQIIRGLEDSLGVRLIDRSRRPLALTPEGKVYYDGCRKLVQNYFALEEEVHSLHQEFEGRVRVASIYSIGMVYGKDLVAEFQHRYPRATVHIEYQHPDRVYQLVSENQVDLGLVSYPQSSRLIGVTAWRSEAMVLVCAPRHELARRRRSLPLRELNGLSIVGFARELRMRRCLDHDLAARGVSLDVVMEFDNVDTIKRAVAVNTGVSLLPEPTVRHEVREGTLVRVDVEGLNLSRPLGILSRRGSELSRTAQAFVRLATVDLAQESLGVGGRAAKSRTPRTRKLAGGRS